MADIITTPEIRGKAPPVTVWTRAAWSDAWTARPHLWCSYVEYTVNPTMPEASLTWRYGRGAQPGETARHTIAKLDIRGHYVKIQIDPEQEYETGDIPPWYGRIIDDTDDRHGTIDTGAVKGLQNGIQTFIAWGMESELDLLPLVNSITAGESGEDVRIGRAIGFNLGGGRHHDHTAGPTGNRHPDVGEKGVGVFCRTFDTAVTWKAAEIVDYLLAYFRPVDADNSTPISWEMEKTTWPVGHLDAYEPMVRYQGKTIRDVLNTIMDRRRASGWYVEVEEEEEATEGEVPAANLRIIPFTHFDEPITLPDGTAIPANPKQVSLDFETSLDIRRATVRATEASRYDQVVVRGASIGAVMTVTTKTGVLARDWTDADVSAYNAAATAEADYADLEKWEKVFRNEAFRKGESGKDDGRMQRVFSWFRLKADWDGKVANLTDDLIQQAICTTDVETGELDQNKAIYFWQAGLRFEHYLPLIESEDYSGTRIADKQIKTTQGEQAEYIPPLVVIRLGKDSGDVDRYACADKLNYHCQETGGSASDRLNFSCNVGARNDLAGLTLRVNGNAQHKIAKTEFVPLATDTETSVLAWEDDILATLYVLTDEPILAQWPTDEAVKDDPDLSGKRIRYLLIEVPDAHLDYVVPNTVVGIRDGLLQRSTSGGVIRDDTKKLQAIARYAAEWYGKDRRTLDLQYRQVRKTVWIGELITTIGSDQSGLEGTKEDIRTVVSRVRFDLDKGETILQTQYAELDLKTM